MRTAALPNFLKLYGVIEEDLDKGIYRMEIENRTFSRRLRCRGLTALHRLSGARL